MYLKLTRAIQSIRVQKNLVIKITKRIFFCNTCIVVLLGFYPKEIAMYIHIRKNTLNYVFIIYMMLISELKILIWLKKIPKQRIWNWS